MANMTNAWVFAIADIFIRIVVSWLEKYKLLLLTWEFGSQSWFTKRKGPSINLGALGGICEDVASMIDGPCSPTWSSDIELHVSLIYDPTCMSRRAFRPKEASLLVWVTLEMATALPGIFMRVYLKSKLVQVQFQPKQQLKLNLLLQAGRPACFIRFKDRNLVLELQDGALDFCQDFITRDLSVEQSLAYFCSGLAVVIRDRA
jgi:hypothetical protein